MEKMEVKCATSGRIDDMSYWSEHYKTNREKMKKQSKEYYEKNRDDILKKQKEKYKQSREQMLERCHNYYENHRSETLQRSYKWYDATKEKNIQFLLDKGLLTDCIIGGFSKEFFPAIDFHHIDPNQKKACISNVMRSRNVQKLLEEASKCVCMCRNCHQLYHSGDELVIEKYNQIIEERRKQYEC